MAGLATKETKENVDKFLNSIENEKRREDGKKLKEIMEKITGKKPKMWGPSIVGFGKYKYKRKGGKEEFEFFNVGFSPRKSNLTIYLTCYLDKEKDLLKKLGKHTHGAGCLYVKSLEDLNIDILKKMIAKSKDNKWGHE